MWAIIALAGLVYLGLCSALFLKQRSLLYFPQPAIPLPNGAQNLSLALEGAQINITTRSSIGESAVLYFGGNAENVTLALPNLLKAYPKHALYLVHYRGFGGSTGEPSEAALVADGFAVFDHIKQKYNAITVVGRSLGSGIATQIAGQRFIEQLILVTPYDSVENVAAQRYPWAPVRWLLKDTYLSWQYAARIQAPIYVIAAEHDQVIPRHNTDALLAHFAAGLAKLTVIPGAGHSDITNHADYVVALQGKYKPNLP